MQDFVFALPTRVVFGSGTIERVGREVATQGKRAFVVTGTTFARRTGLIDHLERSLREAGVEAALYDAIGRNPSLDALDEGAACARDLGADVVVGLGGGGALDAAKAIAVAAYGNQTSRELAAPCEGEPASIEGAFPLVQVPIIASTGSETSNAAMLFDETRRIKFPIRSDHLYAKVAIVDPTLTFTVPPHYTAVGGMNIVSQLLDRYVTSDEFPVTDRIAEGLIRVVMDSLPRAMRRGEDLEARTNLSWVAVMASTAGVAGRSQSTPLLSMAHPLSAHFGVEHGMAVAALWPSYMRYALSNRHRLPQIGRFKRYALLGRQIFGVHETDDEVAAETTSYRLMDWLRGMGMPTDLSQLNMNGFDRSYVGRLAEQAIQVSGTGGRLPGGLSLQDLEHIYEGALRAV